MRLTAPYVTVAIIAVLGLNAWLFRGYLPSDASAAVGWAQVFVGLLGVAVTGLAIWFSVKAGYLHQDHIRAVARAEAMTAAYILTRLAGHAVISADRWLRAAAIDPEVRREDLSLLDRYPEAWKAWSKERLTGYLDGIGRVDAGSIVDGNFISDIVTISTRVRWYRDVAAPHVGNGSMPPEVLKRLSWAARDILFSLSKMAAQVQDARDIAKLPMVEVHRFPKSACPFEGKPDIDKWNYRVAKA